MINYYIHRQKHTLLFSQILLNSAYVERRTQTFWLAPKRNNWTLSWHSPTHLAMVDRIHPSYLRQSSEVHAGKLSICSRSKANCIEVKFRYSTPHPC